MTDAIARLAAALSDRYTIERELGAGGMATVYLAHDIKHDRQVAIKVLRPELAAAVGAERFLSEIKTTANLQHPHILPLFDSGVAEGRDASTISNRPSAIGHQPSTSLFYVMPYVEGESLRDRLDHERQLSIADAVRIATEVASALDYAHRQGIVHRDIKPENILLHDGHALVADFGIALATGSADNARMTETGMSLGTPSYMSPEQAMAEPVIDARADVYALGCVLYEMLLGEPPFTGPTAQAIVAKVMTAEAPSLASLRRTIPTTIDRAVHRALQRVPADRYPTAAAFAEELAGAEAGGTTGAQRSRRVIVAGTGLALVVVAGALLMMRQRAAANGGETNDRSRVIAVLPFRNISQDTAQQYFSAGMTEEIATQLSHVAALRVLGRAATSQYQGASDRLQRMATDLGVGSVVEGSVRLAGDRVRIGVELNDVATGQTLWSEQYDRRLDDVFAVQGDVARKVTTALQATLTPSESGLIGHVATSNMAAYRLYLRALNERAFVRGEDMAQTVLLQQAIELDSNFALAYATLARTYMFRAVAGEPALRDSGFVMARKAIALDSTEAEGYFALGDLLSYTDQLSEARRNYLKALELRPGHLGAMADLANVYVALGRYDEALDWALRSQAGDPTHPHSWYHVGLPMLGLADDSATQRYLLRGNRKLPGQPRIQGLLVWLDLREGRNAAATERANALVRNNPDNSEVGPIRAELAVAVNDPVALSEIEPLALKDPEAVGQMLSESLRSMYALSLQRHGRQSEAAALWTQAAAAAEQAVAEHREGYAAPMELAAINAVQGQKAAALDWLERGYRAGFRDFVILGLDPFFVSLHNEPRYRAVVAQMRRDVADMHARAAKAHPELFATTESPAK